MSALPSDIPTERARLVVLDAGVLNRMAAGDPALPSGSSAERGLRGFSWPSWWPDATDRAHVERWSERVASVEGSAVSWGARAIVVSPGGGAPTMVGHVGFHGQPVDIAVALNDPTYEGSVERSTGGVVEVGYTVFPENRRRGYASEAVTALIAAAEQSGEVSTILATVEVDNAASVSVLERVGGFVSIGRCLSEVGEIETVFRRDAAARR